MLGRIYLWGHLVLDFCCCWEIFNNWFNLFTYYRLCICFIHSWVNFDNSCVLKNLLMSSRLSNLLVYNCSQYSLIIFSVSVRSVVRSPLWFLILVIFTFSLFFLVILTKSLSIVSIFSKKQLLLLLFLSVVFLFSIAFIQL